MRDRRQPEVIAGRVNSDGTIAVGDGFTCVRGGVGIYVLNFGTTFRLISVAVTINAGSMAWEASAYSPNSVQVNTRSLSAVLTDAAFAFLAAGVQA